MAAIKTIEDGLTIASPIAVAATDTVAYLITPDKNVKISAKVTFMNWPDAAKELRMGSDQENGWTIQIDCLVKDADYDQGAAIALAFFDATWAAFTAQQPATARLGGIVDYIGLRAERPLLETIEWGGIGFPGFHMFLDIIDHEVV